MAINIPKCVWEPPKTVDQIFKENYTYVKYKEYGGEMHKFFKCNKCNDMVEEFLLYAHLEDHKNPDALFGQDALEELSKMSEMHIEAMKENLSDEDYEKVKELRRKRISREYGRKNSHTPHKYRKGHWGDDDNDWHSPYRPK